MGFAGAAGRAGAKVQAIVPIIIGPIDRLGALTTIATMLTFDNVPLPVGSG